MPDEMIAAVKREIQVAFHDWFMQSGCDFWSECDAPESLATIAVEIQDAFAKSEREAERAEAHRAATAAEQIAAEIVSIMETHNQQEAERGYVDTPGGLEHMGDVWRLLRGWRDRLASPAPQEETR